MKGTEMFKKATATLLSATIVLTSLTAAPARAASDEDLIKLLFGIAAIAIIADAARDHEPQSEPETQTRHIPRRHRILPSECLVEVDARRGPDVTMFGRRCLERNYRFAARLPEACLVTVENRRGRERVGYTPRCLVRRGFRISERAY